MGEKEAWWTSGPEEVVQIKEHSRNKHLSAPTPQFNVEAGLIRVWHILACLGKRNWLRPRLASQSVIPVQSYLPSEGRNQNEAVSRELADIHQANIYQETNLFSTKDTPGSKVHDPSQAKEGHTGTPTAAEDNLADLESSQRVPNHQAGPNRTLTQLGVSLPTSSSNILWSGLQSSVVESGRGRSAGQWTAQPLQSQ